MKNKDTTIEFLRIVAIWGVVLIHTTSTTLTVSGYYLRHIPFTFFLNQVSRFSVPLFFLISGYVLAIRYTEEINLRSFYKKRLIKLAIPFFIWSFVYYSIVYHAGVKAFFVNSPNILLLGSGAEHLYFIPAIAVLYLIFPFMNLLLRRFPPTKYVFYYFGFFFIGISLLFFDYYLHVISLPTPLRVALLNLPIFSIGIIWARYKSSINTYIKRQRKVFLSIIFFISFLLVVVEGHMLSLNGYFLSYFMSQWRPSVLLYTLCIFTFAILFIPKTYVKIPIFLSSITLFIFFIHIFYIHLFWKIIGAYLFSRSFGHVVETLWFDPLVFCVVLVASYTTAFLIARVPVARTLLGINS